MFAHGAVLRKNFFDAEQLKALIQDHHNAGLSDEEVAVMDFAMKVIHEAHRITPADIEPLRMFGLADEEILDVVLAASARSFFSLTLDALGAQPDEAYREHIHGLEDVLAVGRPYLPAED
jgi:alkylhydroperoxidase family enzyme